MRLYRCLFQTFIHNIHLLNLCPNKWQRSSRLLITSDSVFFVLTDGNLNKDQITWCSGKVLEVINAKVSILAATKDNGSEQIFIWSIRDVSLVNSVREMLVNTVDHHAK